ncbi:hypothetical protein GJ26_00370 [Vibrio cholerae]|nr:hypothetical protein GJ26_00370 [Vibrio cholerae]HAS7761839.1 hypothetical protein [Vibrio cholerae]
MYQNPYQQKALLKQLTFSLNKSYLLFCITCVGNNAYSTFLYKNPLAQSVKTLTQKYSFKKHN